MNYLLGVDLGTSGTKTVLFDEDGNVIASKTIEYPLYQEKNGWAEQEPLDWWNAAADTIHAVITQRHQGTRHFRPDARPCHAG